MYVETGLSASHSVEAEENIIEPLLDFDIFNDVTVQRSLTQYPHLNFENKTQTVKSILKLLWDKFLNVSIFEQFEKFDQVLAVIGIRGHFVHQFEVFLLGLYFIDFINKKNTLFDKSSLNDAIKVWLIVSTAHDFGYPIQDGPSSLLEISKMYKTFGFNEISNSVKKCSVDVKGGRKQELNDIIARNTISEKNLFDFISSKIHESSLLTVEQSIVLLEKLSRDNDHGYISSCILINLIKKKDRKTKKAINILGQAVAAIALHNHDKYLSGRRVLSCKKNIFSVLLFVIDNIQDWSREIIKEEGLSTCKIKKVSSANVNNLIEIEFLLDHILWLPDLKIRTKSWLEKKVSKLATLSDKDTLKTMSLSLKYVTSKGEIIFNSIIDF